MDSPSPTSNDPLLEELLNGPRITATVPNKFPMVESTVANYKIAIIGEHPGKDEIGAGEPFVGASGRLLNAILARNNILRAACLLGNVSQHMPPAGEEWDWQSPEIQEGLVKLKADIATFQPNIVVCVGGQALRAFHPSHSEDLSIIAQRGSLFMGNLDGLQVKCIGTIHTAATFHPKGAGFEPLINFDFKRARAEAETPILVLPQRNFDLDLNFSALIARLEGLPDGAEVSIDIEGGINGIPCISFTDDPFTGFIVPLIRGNGLSKWTPEEELVIWQTMRKVLQDPKKAKVLQNSLYDVFVLAWSFNILVRNVKWDTMLMHWELYCELKKNLGLLCSLYTREPYYKEDRESGDLRVFFEYCCKDSAVTLECKRKILSAMKTLDLQHCMFNHDMLKPLLYMQLRGLKYNSVKASQKKFELDKEIAEWQAKLDKVAGEHLNVKSVPQKRKFLYDTLGMKVHFTRGKDPKITTNDEAILHMWKDTAHPALDLMLQVVRRRTISSMLKVKTDWDGRVRGRYSPVGSETGRVTVRKSPTGSGTNLQTIPDENELYTTGIMHEGLRTLIEADDEHDMCQVDLSGADNWTVAAHAARLGDSNMLNDLLAGIKPAKVLVLMFRGITIPSDRKELATLCDTIKKSDPLYFGAKQCCHGSNYGMGAKLVSDRVFIESDGAIVLTKQQCEKLQHAYFQRYPGVLAWQRWVQEQIRTKRAITSASGHTRRFFANPHSYDTHKQGYADEPQQNTTYVTNLSVLALWRDRANRVIAVREGPNGVAKLYVGSGEILHGGTYGDGGRHSAYALFGHRKVRPGSCIIEPLHQVHDAFLCQWPKVFRDWSRSRVSSYANQTVTIAGGEITIPGEGHYGPSWGEQDFDL